MAKYRVWAKAIGYAYLDVEAEDEDEAYQIAIDADGGEFTNTADGDWEITEIIKEV